jgi:hypothetical protein
MTPSKHRLLVEEKFSPANPSKPPLETVLDVAHPTNIVKKNTCLSIKASKPL